MFLRLFCTLFAVSSGLCANAPIDPDIFRDVFGYPAVGAQAEASSTVAHTSRPFVQVSPITPDNETLVDHDYWDLPEEFTPAAADYDKFDWVLTKRVAASSEENFLLSPLGLKLALAILYEAATGATQAELASVLGFDLDRHDVRRKFSNILGSLQTQSSQYILNLGNRIYVEDSAEPRQRFSAIAEEFYKTELRKVDFNSPAVAARDINSWVYNKTEGKIPKLVNEDDIAGLVVLILNTLYFKGTWRHQFVPSLTNVAPFYVSPTVQKQIPFMNVKNKFFYNESTQFDAKILRMPYLGNKFSMYIIVPNSLTGLPRIFNRLTELRAELLNLREYSVNVTIPKFQFEYTSLLDGILKELGIRQAFEDTASFPGIARGQRLQDRLRVSKVLQRSGIEVNELGSVAYSATEVSLENKFGENNFVLVANKPFLFFIEDEATRQLLFTGRVSDPSLSDGAFKLT